MIPVSDLLKWADEHAIGRSPSYPRGWVSAKDILVLARMVEARDPLELLLFTPKQHSKGEER